MNIGFRISALSAQIQSLCRKAEPGSRVQSPVGCQRASGCSPGMMVQQSQNNSCSNLFETSHASQLQCGSSLNVEEEKTFEYLPKSAFKKHSRLSSVAKYESVLNMAAVTLDSLSDSVPYAENQFSPIFKKMDDQVLPDTGIPYPFCRPLLRVERKEGNRETSTAISIMEHEYPEANRSQHTMTNRCDPSPLPIIEPLNSSDVQVFLHKAAAHTECSIKTQGEMQPMHTFEALPESKDSFEIQETDEQQDESCTQPKNLQGQTCPDGRDASATRAPGALEAVMPITLYQEIQ